MFLNFLTITLEDRATLPAKTHLSHGYVFLIDDTIRENISLAGRDKQADAYRLKLAMTPERISDVVAELPKGLATTLGEMGLGFLGASARGLLLLVRFITSVLC